MAILPNLFHELRIRGVKFVPERDIPDLTDKVVVITGGNGGLGLETITQLAKHNPAHIYLLARNGSSAAAAIATLPDPARASWISCDLSSLASVKEAAGTLLAGLPAPARIDLLFLNAGIMAAPAALSQDGYEIQFATNHLSHALLTQLLLPTLTATAARRPTSGAAPDVRIIALASIGHNMTGRIPLGELHTPQASRLALTRYAQSKLANIQYARALHARVRTAGITVVSVHPGIVDTGLYGHVTTGWFGAWLGRALQWGFGLVSTNVADGARGQLWAAVAARGDRPGEVTGGEYYTPVGVGGLGSAVSKDPEMAEELWVWTERQLERWV